MSISTLKSLVRASFTFFLILLSVSYINAQKGSLENVTVVSFDPPYKALVIDYFGAEMSLLVDNKTAFKGAKNKEIKKDDLESGSIITKLEFVIVGTDRLATDVATNISADGSIKIYGIFEGVSDGKAMIDGYPIQLAPGAVIVGSKNKKCDCKGMVFLGINDPLFQQGQFYVTANGNLNEKGVVSVDELELCRNTFGQPEQELLSVLEANYSNSNLQKVSSVPTGVFEPAMGLHKGQIKVGQFNYELVDDIRLQGYINQVGNKLIPDYAKAQQKTNKLVRYRFYVINSPVPNAFAFPNGMIFINTGLLALMENEAQLAIVLGHEIAHVTHEHGRERYENTGFVKKAKDVGGKLLKNKKVNEWTEGAASEMSPEALSTLMDFSNALTPEAISNILKPQSDFESQSDRIGLFYTFNAGYDIREALTFWAKMAELTKDESFQSKLGGEIEKLILSDNFDLDGNTASEFGEVGMEVLKNQVIDTIYTSHPKAKARIAALNKLINTSYADNDWADTEKGQEKYKKFIRF